MRSTAILALAVSAALLAGAAPFAAGATGATGAAETTRPYHVIYLHGRIVQERQSARPRHPRFGFYELEKILATFRDRGFVVRGEIRPKEATVSQAADRVVGQVRRLLASGVPADHVTVLGGSMGASIAVLASIRLQNPEVRFALLGACLSATVRGFRSDEGADEGKGPSGHLLSIREESDGLTTPCPAWTDDLAAGSPVEVRERVISTGLEHGYLYRPLAEWVEPVVEWARGSGANADQSL